MSRIGIAVYCTKCGKREAPHGRSVPDQLDLCRDGCPGYDREPLPGCLWPGETGKEFGFAHCDNAMEDAKR